MFGSKWLKVKWGKGSEGVIAILRTTRYHTNGGDVLFTLIRIFRYSGIPLSTGLFYYQNGFNDFRPVNEK